MTAWADLTDCEVDFNPSKKFRLVANLRDATGAPAEAELQATAGNLSRTIIAGTVSGAYGEVETDFPLPEGDWAPATKATNASGRDTAAVVRQWPCGYGRPAGGDCANPVIRVTSTSGGKPVVRNVTLSCSTPEATIDYQITNRGGSPGGTSTTFAGGTAAVVGTKHQLTYATAAGTVDSTLVTRNYGSRRPNQISYRR